MENRGFFRTSLNTTGIIRMIQFTFRLSRCLLSACELGCLEEMLKLVSIMSVETIFLSNTAGADDQTKLHRQKFTISEGDHLTLLNVYKTFVANKKRK
ncbi:unnamed protein product, partial [Didymodactylos carnosus]